MSMIPKTLHRFGATVYHAAELTSSRNKLDVFTDRVRQAAVEPTLLAFGQRLTELMGANTSELNPESVTSFITTATSAQSAGALKWIREHHTLFAVLCASKFELADGAMKDLQIDTLAAMPDHAVPRRPYEIAIRATCHTPLAHGADNKSGNATLFRRMGVLGVGGTMLELPYVAGNAIRGQMRDALADHFGRSLGLTPSRSRPPYALWFFHALYAGGALEERSSSTKALAKLLGDNGAIRSDGIRAFRDHLPALSLLGCALGNRVINGHVEVGDLRPICYEWGTGEKPVAELFDWLFLTRREDHEDHKEHSGMIAVTEVLRPGTCLEGGIDTRLHISDLARSALGCGIGLLQQQARMGAQSRADFGSVTLEVDNLPDAGPYESYLADNKKQILDFLASIEALAPDARDNINF